MAASRRPPPPPPLPIPPAGAAAIVLALLLAEGRLVPPAQAALAPGGALTVRIGGFVRALGAYGGLDRRPDLAPAGAGAGLDLLNDTELHVLVRGTDDATGLDFGATVELEADTSRADQADETWLFLRGARWGELRLGDTDSAADALRVGAELVAVGTGGIDGRIVDLPPVVTLDFAQDRPALLPGTRAAEDPTRLVYYSPPLLADGQAQLGLSYAPGTGPDSGGDRLEPVDAGQGARDVEHELALGLVYAGLLGRPAAAAAATWRVGLTGVLGAQDPDGTGGLQLGAGLELGRLSLAGGAGLVRRGGRYGPRAGAASGKGQERRFHNLGVAWRQDLLAFSLTWGRARVEAGDRALEQGRYSDLVLGAELGLAQGLTLSTELARFSIKRPFAEADLRRDADGWVGVTRLALAF